MRKLYEWGIGLSTAVGVATLGLLSTVANAQTVINFPNFSGPPTTIHFAGTTGVSWSGSTLQLTNIGVHSATNAYFTTPVNVQAFTTTFNFTITCPSDCGDGLGFIWINPVTPLGNALQGAFWSGWSGAQFSWSEGCTGGSDEGCAAISSAFLKLDMYDVTGGHSPAGGSGGPGYNLTGYYTGGVYPQPPTNPEFDMASSGINLQSGDLFSLTLVYNGTVLTETLTDTVTHATYKNSYTTNIPAAVGGDTAIVGFGGGTGGAQFRSNIESWTYTVKGTPTTMAEPSFSPSSGTYTSAQSVTISDVASDATIYYTTNGTTPTTSSTEYTGPITIGSTERLEAIAVATGDTNSAVASAAYTITSIGVGSPMTCLPLQSVPGEPGTLQTACTITLNP